MDKKTFTPLNLALNAIAAFALLQVALHAGAPLIMKPGLRGMSADIIKACEAVKGCKRYAVGSRWNAANGRHEAYVTLAGSMAETDKAKLKSSMEQLFNEEADKSLFYRANLRSVAVEFKNG